MYTIFYRKLSDTVAAPELTYGDGIIPPQELLDSKEYIQVENIPEPEQIDGKYAKTYINLVDNTIYYEYEDIPKTAEQIQAEEIENLKKQLEATKEAVDFLIMGGM